MGLAPAQNSRRCPLRACLVPAAGPTVQARCRLGSRQCRLGAGSVPACAYSDSNLVSAGAGSIPASGPLQARFSLVPARCHRAGSVPASVGIVSSVIACAGSVLAGGRLGSRSAGWLCWSWFPATSRQCLLGAGLVLAGDCSVPARFSPVPARFPPVQARFQCLSCLPRSNLMNPSRVQGDQLALTPQNSDCIQAQPPFQGSHHCLGPCPRAAPKEEIGAS